MKIDFTKKFWKQYYKLPKKFQKQFDERVKIFVVDPTNPKLRVHPLKGKFAGYWSMDVTGDIRALYIVHGDEIIIFGLIGTHSQLYGK